MKASLTSKVTGSCNLIGDVMLKTPQVSALSEIGRAADVGGLDAGSL
jgi:hypothetical protein